MVGLALQVAGCITTVLAAPRTDLEVTGPEEKGDLAVMLVGILGFGLGGVLSLIAVIALGVLLGMQAHAERKGPVAGGRRN